MFINYYDCPDCHKEWTSAWSSTCDDTCPYCGCRNISPYQSTDEPENECGLCFQKLDENGFHEDGVCPEMDDNEYDEYENEPKRGKVSKPSHPQGSLTNHLRSTKSNRDGAHKRSKRLNKGT